MFITLQELLLKINFALVSTGVFLILRKNTTLDISSSVWNHFQCKSITVHEKSYCNLHQHLKNVFTFEEFRRHLRLIFTAFVFWLVHALFTGTKRTVLNVHNTCPHHRWKICQFGQQFSLSVSTQTWMFLIMYNWAICLGVTNLLHSSGNQLLIKPTTLSLCRAKLYMLVSGMWCYTNQNLCL